MGEREIAKEIMEERLRDGIELVEKIAKEKGINFINDAIFIKGIEVGVSLFIQKEQSRRFSQKK